MNPRAFSCDQRRLRHKQRDPRTEHHSMQNQQGNESLGMKVRPQIKRARKTDEHNAEDGDPHAAVKNSLPVFFLPLPAKDF